MMTHQNRALNRYNYGTRESSEHFFSLSATRSRIPLFQRGIHPCWSEKQNIDRYHLYLCVKQYFVIIVNPACRHY